MAFSQQFESVKHKEEGTKMDFPIVTKAEEPFQRIFPKKKFNQEVLMTAEYSLGGKAYRVVGIVKKNMFGIIKDYNFHEFVVADEMGNVTDDYHLSKQMYDCYTTLAMLYQVEKHIKGSMLENPAYFSPLLSNYEKIWCHIRPIFLSFRFPEEWYKERFDAFYQFLVRGNATNIEAEPLARELFPFIDIAKKLVPVRVKEIEALKIKLTDFIQLTHERTLLVLKNKEVFSVIKSVFSRCASDKEINMDTFKEEVRLIEEIIRGSNVAIRESIISADLELKIDNAEQLISNVEELWQRGTLVDDLTNKGFQKQWLYRKSIKP
jgi:hypothetical protein